MTVSVMRAIGPAATNSLFSISIGRMIMGGWLVYYILVGVVLVSLFVGSFLPRKLWTQTSG